MKARRRLAVSIKGTVQFENGLSFKFVANASGRVVWLPKALCSWKPATSIMTMPAWFATEKGLL